MSPNPEAACWLVRENVSGDGPPQPGSLMHLAVSEYFPAKILKVGTLRAYRRALTEFSEYLGRPAMLDDLTDANVAGMVKALLTKKRRLSAKTADNHRRHIRSL